MYACLLDCCVVNVAVGSLSLLCPVSALIRIAYGQVAAVERAVSLVEAKWLEML